MEYEEEQETPAERCFWRKVGFAVFIGISLALILGPLYGCATAKEETADVRVCAFQLIGKTGNDLPVVRMHCVTQEQFAESQK